MIDVKTELRNIIVEKYGCDAADVTSEAQLYEDLALDSLDKIELQMECEERFNRSFDDDKWTGCKTVAELTDLIQERFNY